MVGKNILSKIKKNPSLFSVFRYRLFNCLNCKHITTSVHWLYIIIFILSINHFASSFAYANNPSQYSKQLHIGALAYCSSVIWSNDNLRDWFAERYDWCVGACDSLDIVAMKAINPNMKVIRYDIFIRMAEDTVNVKNWADSVGVDFESLIIRANTGPGDSLRCRASYYGAGGFNTWRTTQPGGIMLYSGFTDAQTRFAWDFRNPMVGAYLAYAFRKFANDVGCDGIMMDEEGVVGATGNNTSGLITLQPPFKDINSSYWTAGGPYSWQNPWSSSLSITQIRDSLKVLRGGWMKTLGDSMAAHGMLVIPNWASSGGPYNSMTNWNNEARHCHVAYTRGALMGEYCYYCPSANGQEQWCNNAASACSSVADSSVELWIWPIRAGQFDTSATDSFTIARARMNALGFMLDCLYPGSTYRFAVHPAIKVNFLLGRWLNGIQLDDTTTNWDYAWGKYFGLPTYERDETTNGVDGVGQSYTIHKIVLKDPRDTTKIQTFVVGRYCRGNNRRKGATSITVDLGGTYYELLSGGYYSGPVTSTTVANAEWRIFVADTTFANNGPAEDVVPPSDIDDVSAVPGNNHGEIDMSWTAPGDDGDNGTASYYIIKYSTEVIDDLNWPFATSVLDPPIPSPSGQTENFTISGLLEGENYYIGIKAYDESDNGSGLSNIANSFAGGIMVPIPISTDIDSAGNAVTLSADCIESYVSVYYEFALDSVISFPDPQMEVDFLADSITTAVFDSLSEDVIYFWRCHAKASDNSDSSDWTLPISFNIVTGITQTLTAEDCIYPVQGQIVENNKPVFSVRYVPGINQIYFQVDENPQFDSPYESGPVMTTLGSNTNWQLTEPITPGITYYWRVSSDNLVWMAPISFTAELKVHPYPNPYKVSSGHTNITFTNLLDNSDITITTISGDIVLKVRGLGPGDWIWDVKNDKGEDVAPGIYLYSINYPFGSTSGKLIVIR